MIPKKSTPIKNEILIDIFAKGLLSKDEMRIVSYIIRWSWGFDGKYRRQDFTKELTKRQIANDIGMDEGHLNRNINKMIVEKKITDQEGCYQFNEHYTEWKNLTISQVKKPIKLDEKSSKTYQIVKQNLTISQVKLDEKSCSTPLKPISDKTLPNPKETKRNYKETSKGENKPFKTSNNDIEYDWDNHIWVGIADDQMETWQEKFPLISVSYILQDVMRTEFKKDPKKYKEEAEKYYRGQYQNMIWDWLERNNNWKKAEGMRNMSHISKELNKINMPEMAKGG